MGLDREIRKVVSGVKEEVHKKTGVSSTGKIKMEVDTSDYAMRGVLSMECEDGRQRLVAFLSKSLNETEINYKIHDKEMLVAIKRLEN